MVKTHRNCKWVFIISRNSKLVLFTIPRNGKMVILYVEEHTRIRVFFNDHFTISRNGKVVISSVSRDGKQVIIFSRYGKLKIYVLLFFPTEKVRISSASRKSRRSLDGTHNAQVLVCTRRLIPADTFVDYSWWFCWWWWYTWQCSSRSYIYHFERPRVNDNTTPSGGGGNF